MRHFKNKSVKCEPVFLEHFAPAWCTCVNYAHRTCRLWSVNKTAETEQYRIERTYGHKLKRPRFIAKSVLSGLTVPKVFLEAQSAAFAMLIANTLGSRRPAVSFGHLAWLHHASLFNHKKVTQTDWRKYHVIMNLVTGTAPYHQITDKSR